MFGDRLNDIKKKKNIEITFYTKLILMFVENVVEKAVRPVSINMTTHRKHRGKIVKKSEAFTVKFQ